MSDTAGTDSAIQLHTLIVQLGDSLQELENHVGQMAAKLAADTPNAIDNGDLQRLRDSVESLRSLANSTVQMTAAAAGVAPPAPPSVDVVAPPPTPVTPDPDAPAPTEQGVPTNSAGQPITPTEQSPFPAATDGQPATEPPSESGDSASS